MSNGRSITRNAAIGSPFHRLVDTRFDISMATGAQDGNLAPFMANSMPYPAVVNGDTGALNGLTADRSNVSSGIFDPFARSAAGGSTGVDQTLAKMSTAAGVDGNSTALTTDLTVGGDAVVEINGPSDQAVTFLGIAGTLKLDNSLAFTGNISGLTGSDTLDLADVSYGANTTATFLGNTNGGILTVTNGTNTANIALQGNYLSSNWTLSSDGNGGTLVVDPVASNNWQTLDVGAGGYVDGIDVAPDGTMVVRTDTYGAYIWNGTEWQQLVTATSMPAAFVAENTDAGVLESRRLRNPNRAEQFKYSVHDV